MDIKYQLIQGASLHNGQVRGRYAPSPSGELHLGNIQTAIIAWLQARLSGGEFILRMDDIDTPRVKKGSAMQILDDLHGLGFDWDSPKIKGYVYDAHGVCNQSEHHGHYQAAFDTLQDNGYLFPCTCSRRDIRSIVNKSPKWGQIVYPGTCRNNNLVQIGKDTEYAWRFRVSDHALHFADGFYGAQTQDVTKEMGDFLIKRRNGLFAYQLASVVDDINMGVTDVVRGADLIDATPSQILLTQALGEKAPRYWHAPIKNDATGRKLAKRDGSDSLKALMKNGMTVAQIIGGIAFDVGFIDRKEMIGLNELLMYLKRH